MLNIEKYKDEILNAAQSDITCCAIDLHHNGICPDDCKDCKREAMKWLLSEASESILNDSEREYLSAVIKPFRKNVMDVVKTQYSGGKQSIRIRICAGDYVELPLFNNNTMYKGMDVGKYYTPEELEL
jgi:hypothetical protein